MFLYISVEQKASIYILIILLVPIYIPQAYKISFTLIVTVTASVTFLNSYPVTYHLDRLKIMFEPWI